MEHEDEPSLSWTPRYDAVFSIFLVVSAFLWRDNPHMVYPHALILLLAMMGLNLAAGICLRRLPDRPLLSAAVILANAAAVTAVVAYSGGAESNLWTLYLLPITTACMLLERRPALWVAAGAVAFNAAYHLVLSAVGGHGELFSLGLKSGVLVFAAATTSRLVERQRGAAAKASAQREKVLRLETRLEAGLRDEDGRAALAEVGMAAAGVAHDLKTPLLVINATLELLAGQEGAEAFHRDFERIRRAARHCQEIVASVLDRARSGGRERGACSLKEAAESAAELCRPGLGDRGIAIRLEVPEGLPLVSGDSLDLMRLFQNLLWNARDALLTGGVIVIGARTRSGPGPFVEAWVQDDGPGIPEEKIETLFAPFCTSKADMGGTGLGLSLCRRTALKNGGTLSVEHPAGGGACFVLRLPVRPWPCPPGRRGPPGPCAGGPSD
ncbi:MAG: HAMP domain-containing sensor histidine kinase [Elusimicrobiota bacterium]|jgi:signal transduction histidine kinase